MIDELWRKRFYEKEVNRGKRIIEMNVLKRTFLIQISVSRGCSYLLPCSVATLCSEEKTILNVKPVSYARVSRFVKDWRIKTWKQEKWSRTHRSLRSLLPKTQLGNDFPPTRANNLKPILFICMAWKGNPPPPEFSLIRRDIRKSL